MAKKNQASETVVMKKEFEKEIVPIETVKEIEPVAGVAEEVVAEVKAVEPVEPVAEKKKDIVLTTVESNTMGNYLRQGMAFTDARKKILDARKPTVLVDANTAEIKEAKREVRFGKNDAERKLHMCNLLGMGKNMEQAMKIAYGEGSKNIDGVIYTKDQLKLIEN